MRSERAETGRRERSPAVKFTSPLAPRSGLCKNRRCVDRIRRDCMCNVARRLAISFCGHKIYTAHIQSHIVAAPPRCRTRPVQGTARSIVFAYPKACVALYDARASGARCGRTSAGEVRQKRFIERTCSAGVPSARRASPEISCAQHAGMKSTCTHMHTHHAPRP